MPKKFAWSYSALTGYETCPKQHYHLKVAKDVREAPSKAMLEGQKVHAAFEQRVRDKKPLPGNLSQHESLCKRFDKTSGSVSVELKLALNQSLEPTEFLPAMRGCVACLMSWSRRAKWLRCLTTRRVSVNQTVSS
jgi:CRISPR/Cas system-associated exonuclease Cas4 (RecB family)